jgi:hypothetical protein
MAGNFCWYEHMTIDMKAAQTFYGAVVGWTMRDAGMPGMAYTLLAADGVDVGGMMALPQNLRDGGARPAWMAHIAVDDVDAAAARVATAGGSIHRPPADIPNVGRFAVVADPQGATFMLFQPLRGLPKAAAPGTPGHIGWHELFTTDNKAAFDFYAKQFGWTKAASMDMGAMGTYEIFAIDGAQSGGMMNKPEAIPKPVWLYYFNVDAIDAAAGRVTNAGGKIVMGPHEVPGGQWIVQCVDPQGAAFALVAPKR